MKQQRLELNFLGFIKDEQDWWYAITNHNNSITFFPCICVMETCVFWQIEPHYCPCFYFCIFRQHSKVWHLFLINGYGWFPIQHLLEIVKNMTSHKHKCVSRFMMVDSLTNTKCHNCNKVWHFFKENPLKDVMHYCKHKVVI